MPEYDGSDATVILGGERIEQLLSIETPDISYDREYTDTLSDDDNILNQDQDPDLEGEVEVAPTSGSISHLEGLLEAGSQETMTIRFPPDHANDSETYVDAVITDRSDDTFDGEEVNSRTYSYIADDYR